MIPNAFAILNRRVHRYPAIVSRARDEIPPDATTAFTLRSMRGWSYAKVPVYSSPQLAKLAARIEELIDEQTIALVRA